jgi:hypothetical protein
MQLQPGERAVFAYFADDDAARAAADALKETGYSEIQVDRISSYPTATASRRSKTSLSTLTMNNSQANLSYGPLIAADPAASGMSADYPSTGSSIVLTLVCDENARPQAVAILRQYGASV